MKRGLLFDFFGTLVDYDGRSAALDFSGSYEVLRQSGFPESYGVFRGRWNGIYAAFTQSSGATLKEFHMYEAARALFLPYDQNPTQADLSAFIETYLAEWSRGVTYKNGLRDLLCRLREDFVLGLVSNTNYTPLVIGHLEAIGIRDLFPVVVTSADLGIRKPHPGIFQEAINRMGINNTDAVYIGDDYANDYCGASGAQIRCLLIDPECKQAIAAEDRIDSVFDIPSRLANIDVGPDIDTSPLEISI